MPRKKPMTTADCIDSAAVLSDSLMPPLEQAEREIAQRIADLTPKDAVTLRYSPTDMDKLDQFAIGLLGPNTGAGYSNDEIFASRVRAAYLRAEVVLTIRKEIAALGA